MQFVMWFCSGRMGNCFSYRDVVDGFQLMIFTPDRLRKSEFKIQEQERAMSLDIALRRAGRFESVDLYPYQEYLMLENALEELFFLKVRLAGRRYVRPVYGSPFTGSVFGLPCFTNANDDVAASRHYIRPDFTPSTGSEVFGLPCFTNANDDVAAGCHYIRPEFTPFTDVFPAGLPCFAKETEDGVLINVELAGFSKEDIAVDVEQDMLVIRSKTPLSAAEEEDGGYQINLPEIYFKLEDTKAEMKNGLLKLFVPKRKKQLVRVVVE